MVANLGPCHNKAVVFVIAFISHFKKYVLKCRAFITWKKINAI